MAAAPLKTPMERAPVPDLGTERIPKERYTTADFAEREWEKLWTKVWLMTGRESDIRTAAGAGAIGPRRTSSPRPCRTSPTTSPAWW